MLNDRRNFGGMRSQNQKEVKKPQKSLKKALTFLWNGDIITKLTRAAPKSQANGTEP